MREPVDSPGRDVIGDKLTPLRRLVLLFVAFVFVVGCGILSLGWNAVPKSELGAVILAMMYVLTASRLQKTDGCGDIKVDRIRPLALDRQLSRSTVRVLLGTSAVISLLVPWGWIAVGGNRELELLAPHLFLMMAQVLFEIWSYREGVSVVVRIGIPVGFVAYRLRVLVRWVERALEGGERQMVGLAVVNLGFWGVVLFYVLLLKVCPPYFVDRGIDGGETEKR
eukprot:GFKZ01015237.1.p1 GENE.GFKZ01015237.1~~GFKZ01015237.1.p1  ORF type:complete len:224 (+),score=26.90 GFKZ01015237.1:132-803(+)